jgi:hypothetical protein
MNTKKLFKQGLGAVVLLAGIQQASAATTQISFSGAGGTMSAPTLSPTMQATLQQLTNTNLFDGMFLIRDFNPTGFTGTKSFNGRTSDSGVEFLLHSNRFGPLEGIRLRAGLASRSDNAPPLTANNVIIVPRTADWINPFDRRQPASGAPAGFLGSGSVTFLDGVVTGFRYEMGPEALGTFDGFIQAQGLSGISFEHLLINAGSITLNPVFVEGGADPNARTPYGFNGNGYIWPGIDSNTTRFEASDPGICSDRFVGDLCSGHLDPFNANIGLNPMVAGEDLFHYNLTGLNAQVSAVPLPASVWMMGSALMGIVGLRGKRRASNVT